MPLSSDQLIREFVQEATAESIAEQRRKQRWTFFRPATITLADTEALPDISVFTRDISAHGIGLLHDAPFQVDSLKLGIPEVTRRRDDLSVEIVWTHDVGQGWYTSGGRFSNMSVKQSITLLMTAVGKDIALRLKQRFPFFRPATISLFDQPEDSGFVTDISLEGIGLLSRNPLEAGSAIVKIPTRFGNPADVRVDLKWSRPIGFGWHIGGGCFKRMDFGELPGRSF